MAASPELLARLTEAADSAKVSYVLSRTILTAKPVPEGANAGARAVGWARRALLEGFYGIFVRLGLAQWEGWAIPHVGLFEIGIIAQV